MLIEFTCKNCGSPLQLNIDSLDGMKATCEFCRTQYLIEELITEKRLDNIDMVNRLTPIAENYYKLYEYSKAYDCYERLISVNPSRVNIARYNMCRLGVFQLTPNEDVYNSLVCLDNAERYKHIRKIKKRAKVATDKQLRYLWSEGRGVQKLWHIYKTLIYYNKYKWLELMVREMNCTCGETVEKGATQCKCTRNRKEIVDSYLTRKRGTVISVVLLVALLIMLYFALF